MNLLDFVMGQKFHVKKTSLSLPLHLVRSVPSNSTTDGARGMSSKMGDNEN
jgi:hypothetical protein